MNQHYAHGCAEKETAGFQRRNMLKSAAACLTLGGLCTAMARQHGNILEHSGDAQVNGQQLVPGQSLQTGDQIQTGPGAGLIFVIGDSAFKVGENSELSLERGNSLQTVSQLRLLKGAVLSVWGKGSQCQIVTPTLTAGFRGGAVYTEVSVKSRQRSYLCNCYGTLALSAGKEKNRLCIDLPPGLLVSPRQQRRGGLDARRQYQPHRRGSRISGPAH